MSSPSNNNASSSSPDWKELRRLLTKYNYQDDIHKSHYAYGTAGFRYHATELSPILLRVGVAAALLCYTTTSDVGVMVTASHNTEEYNGVKLAGPDGGMIDPEGEALAVQVVNERRVDACLALVQARLTSSLSSNTRPSTATARVHVGRDTRAHSAALACLVQAGVRCCHPQQKEYAVVVDHGVVTTPMLHHAVRHANGVKGVVPLPLAIPTVCDTAGYYALLTQSYATLLATKTNATAGPIENPVLTVDCACGVGYPHLVAILERLREGHVVAAATQQDSATSNTSKTNSMRRIVAANPPGAGPLNESCGSECVQKGQRPPSWYDGAEVDQSYCASLDGDSDRIVFFSVDTCNNNKFTLLDGDKMACLIGNFLQDQFTAVWTAASTNANTSSSPLPAVSLGVVQTAYANGASTDYLARQGVATGIAKTGVKYVHAMAHKKFDVGVYFESNGHGTVLFGEAYFEFLVAAHRSAAVRSSPAAMVALQRLKVLPSLVNQAVGDALSDLLLVDAILQLQGWSVSHWANALYQDLPSRQLKVKVADRTIIRTNDNETRCVAPSSVQAELDAAVSACPKGRAFVRPSGTEDVVRIYAEAATAAQADALAQTAADVVYRLCGGVGKDKPSHSRM